MTGRRVLGGALAVTALVLLLGRWTAGLYTEYLWYASLGALDVWRARRSTTVALAAASFVAAALFAFINFLAVRRSVVSLVLPRRIGNIEIGEQVPGHFLLGAVGVLSVVVGALLIAPLDGWHEALLAFVGKPFAEVDPYFEADLGFFVYWLPFETSMHLWAVMVLTSVTGLVVLLYALTPSLRWERGTLFVSAYVRRHFVMLGAVLMLVLAWSYRLGMYRTLVSGGGPAGVFTSTDHQLVPVMLLLAVYTVCAALVVAWAGWTGQTRLAFAAVTTVLLFSLASRTIAPLVMRPSVDPVSNLLRESPYTATRLNFTRRAYGVDRMHAELLGAGFATAGDATSRLAVWDGATLARAVERAPRVRAIGVRAGWQASAGRLSALLVERVSDAAGGSRDAWTVAKYDASGADERGSPRRMLDEMSSGDLVLATEPAVFDSAPAYSVLSDSLRQIAGVELVSTRSRLTHAWGLQNFRLLLGDLPANRPVIVQRRAIRERLQALTPFFEQGSEIVPVVTGDTLYWAVELYATSATYPLSQRFTVLGDERSYMQHAATALVHAASGRVLLIAAASPDPVTSSWMGQLPGLLKPASFLSPALRSQLPPITDGARIQALAFAAAGFRGDSLEVKHFASPDGADSSAAAHEPTYALLPNLGGVASLWPLLDSTERVRGTVAAVGGPSRLTAWLPVASDGRRWGAVVDLLRMADSAQHESGVVRAPLRVAPLLDRALYVQPIFQWRSGTTPVLSRIAASVHDTVRVGPSLAASLGIAAESRTSAGTAPPAIRPRADSLYQVMRDALGRGDWATFGRAFNALGAVLRETIP